MTAEQLEALSQKATQGEWRYRPDRYDDWGIVKSPVLSDGFACVLAQFRDPDALDSETLARHREAKTDPWEANARFIVALVNAYRTGQLILVDQSAVERVAAARIEALTAERDQARAKAIADVVAWLRAEHVKIRAMLSPVRNLDDIATALETGEWEK